MIDNYKRKLQDNKQDNKQDKVRKMKEYFLKVNVFCSTSSTNDTNINVRVAKFTFDTLIIKLA